MQQKIVCSTVLALLLSLGSAHAYWHNLLTDDFSQAGAWSYQGATNISGQPLFRYDPVNQVVQAEWDQANRFNDHGDPYFIINSVFHHPLAQPLTDRRTFRFGGTLNIVTRSIPDTTEFFQIANFGLCNLAVTGPDRTMTDNWSGNTTILKDASDFIEFNYFINNNSWGFNPNIQPTIGAHIDGLDGEYTVGSGTDTGFWNNTDMGPDHYLPTDTNLYIEVIYYGAATGSLARRAYAAIYTEPERTNILFVNGVSMHYWTQPLPEDQFFTLTDFAFLNYPTANWGGANGIGMGSFDDVYADLHIAEGEFFAKHMNGEHLTLSIGAISGAVYQIESCSDLALGNWITNEVTQAGGEVVTFTNQLNGNARYYRVSQ